MTRPKTTSLASQGAIENLRTQFANWLLDPERSGTQAEWAKAHGLSPSTLSDWKRTPEVQVVLGQWREALRPVMGEIAAELTRRALSGHVGAARLVATLLDEAPPRGASAPQPNRPPPYVQWPVYRKTDCTVIRRDDPEAASVYTIPDDLPPGTMILQVVGPDEVLEDNDQSW